METKKGYKKVIAGAVLVLMAFLLGLAFGTLPKHNSTAKDEELSAQLAFCKQYIATHPTSTIRQCKVAGWNGKKVVVVDTLGDEYNY